jgi:hypothetical protein
LNEPKPPEHLQASETLIRSLFVIFMTPSFAIPICKVNLSEKVCEKLIQLIETFSDTRIGLLRAARLTPVMDEKITEDERKRSGARNGSDFCDAKVC